MKRTDATGPRRKRKQIHDAMEKLLSMPPPQLDLNKIRAAMLEHDRTCTLCHAIFGRRNERC